MKTPYIFDIKRASTSDGPGIRTAVFLKGCNLNCYWCHNPESKKANPEMAFYREKCIGCQNCRHLFEKEENKECLSCGRCADICPAEAIKLYGKEYSADEIFEVIVRDKDFFMATGGGVTFSGGECMLYPDFLAAVLKKCKESGIHTAIDTAGSVPYSSFEQVLPFADLFLFDIKALDPELHKRGTGRDNRLILNNLEKLISAGKRILVRVPVIPGFNDGEELLKIKSFLEDKGLPYELLEYHEYGIGKGEALRDFGKKRRLESE